MLNAFLLAVFSMQMLNAKSIVCVVGADVSAKARRLRRRILHEDVAHGFAANGARPTRTAQALPPALVSHASQCVQSWRIAKPPCAVRM